MLLYKELGLSNEEVCELGKWKNLQAFSTHYLRLDAVKKAENLLTNSLVDKVSPGNCEQHDLSSTPGKNLTREEETRSAMHKALVRSRLCAGKLFIASFFCARGPSYCLV